MTYVALQVLVPNTRRMDDRWALQVADIHAASCYLGNAVGIVTPKSDSRGTQGKSDGQNTRIGSSGAGSQ
jgi:hypothetical protein